MKRRFLFLLAVCVLLAGSFTTTAYGAEASVTLKSVEQIQEGDSFAAGLVYEGEDLVSATVEVTYDEEILEYRSCSGGEGFAEGGLVRISLYDGEGTDTLTCKIRFRGIAEGESFVTVTTAALRDSEDHEIIAETQSVKVTVTEAKEPEINRDPGEIVAEDMESDHPSGKQDVQKETITLQQFMEGLSEYEFLGFCICLSVIVLLLVLLAAQRGKRK